LWPPTAATLLPDWTISVARREHLAAGDFVTRCECKARRKEGRAGSKRQHLASWNEKPVEVGAMLAATQWRLSILAALVSPRYNYDACPAH
jgi:hypothetical protein